MEENKQVGLSWFLLILLSVVWGASYILIKFSLENTATHAVRLSPEQLGSLRMTIAGLVLSPFFFKNLKNIKRKHIFSLIIAGVCGNGLPSFLFAYAESELGSAITGMLNSIVPIFAIIIATMIFKFQMKWNHLVGMSIGVTGAIMLMISDLGDVDLTWSSFIPFLFVILATLCYAISLNVIKYTLSDLKPMTITSTSFFIVGVPCFVYFLTLASPDMVQNIEVIKGMGYVSILAIIGTAVAVYLFNHLIKISSPVFASSVTYLIPVFAALFGFLDGEQLNQYHFIGMLVLIAGVLLVNMKFKNVGK